MSLFQESQQASRMSSSSSKTRIESQFCRRNRQMFSTELSSGDRDGDKMMVRFSGTLS